MEINAIPEAFQTKLRLAVLSSLLTGKKNFRELKTITSATDGNLGAQIKKFGQHLISSPSLTQVPHD